MGFGYVALDTTSVRLWGDCKPSGQARCANVFFTLLLWLLQLLTIDPAFETHFLNGIYGLGECSGPAGHAPCKGVYLAADHPPTVGQIRFQGLTGREPTPKHTCTMYNVHVGHCRELESSRAYITYMCMLH